MQKKLTADEVQQIILQLEKYLDDQYITIGDLRKIITSMMGIHKFKVSDITLDFSEKLIIILLLIY